MSSQVTHEISYQLINSISVVFTAVKIQVLVYWIVTPCSVTEEYTASQPRRSRLELIDCFFPLLNPKIKDLLTEKYDIKPGKYIELECNPTYE
jgi:hypothetical protein